MTSSKVQSLARSQPNTKNAAPRLWNEELPRLGLGCCRIWPSTMPRPRTGVPSGAQSPLGRTAWEASAARSARHYFRVAAASPVRQPSRRSHAMASTPSVSSWLWENWVEILRLPDVIQCLHQAYETWRLLATGLLVGTQQDRFEKLRAHFLLCTMGWYWKMDSALGTTPPTTSRVVSWYMAQGSLDFPAVS